MPPYRAVRVLHLRDSSWVDGPGRTIIESGRHFDRQRVDYHIGVLTKDDNTPHPMLEAARRNDLQGHRIIDRAALDWGLARQIENLVAELKIDVVHSSDIRTNLFNALCDIPRRVARVATAHGWIANTFRRRVLRAVDKMLLRRFDAVVFVSAATSKLVPQWWLPESRRHVLPNALPVGELPSPTAAKNSSTRTVNLLNVGRLSPEKGQTTLLRAFASVAGSCPDLRLLIAGNGPLEAALRDEAARLGIAERVDFLGFVRDMGPVYSRAHLVVQSSETEGMPNVVLEAAVSGVPVIATSVGGTAEIIEHGRSGWLIEARSEQALAASIRRFLEQRDDFAQMAVRARAHVVAHHSFTGRTERMTTIYEDLVGERGA